MLVEYWDGMREYRAMQIRNEGGWTGGETGPVNKTLGDYKQGELEANKRAADDRSRLSISYSTAPKAAATSGKPSAESARPAKQE
ncbi:MAG: hypothetical protein LQ350_001861 [Teloschistes chrysophthalmus]|nr:MAG: hypothetical protein LQ350_001861 [Niorma chrysophthalma]